jgi:CheY-like chemotaxis protein
MDLTMPGLDGIETAQRLRAKNPRVPILLMSGFASERAADRFTGDLLAGFLQKPFTAEQLSRAVRRALGSSSSAPAPSSPRLS